MADVNGILSIRILDDPGSDSTGGEQVSMPIYFTEADTRTLAQLVSDLQTAITDVEAVTDGQILRARAILDITLPGGLKTAPVSGSDVEETGLLTFPITTPSGKSFGVDIPAVAQSTLLATDPKKVDPSNTDINALVNLLTGSTTPTYKNNLWSTTLDTPLRRADKTFRKHRRAARRA